MTNEAYDNLKKRYPQGIPFCIKWAINDAIKEAKKEVFEDLDNVIGVNDETYYKEIKKKHLGTSPPD